jgi:hypothetical protein
MFSLEELRSMDLLTQSQFLELRAWVESPLPTPEAVQLMPDHLWAALTQASLLLELDEDLATMH